MIKIWDGKEHQIGNISSNFTEQGKTRLWIYAFSFSMSLLSFSSYETTKGIVINLLNGMKTKATHKGVIKLCD